MVEKRLECGTEVESQRDGCRVVVVVVNRGARDGDVGLGGLRRGAPEAAGPGGPGGDRQPAIQEAPLLCGAVGTDARTSDC